MEPAPKVNIRIFRYIDETIISAFDSIIDPVASNLMGSLLSTAILGATLYIVVTGVLIGTGAVRAPLFSFLKTCAKIGIVGALALSAPLYLGGVVSAFQGLEAGLVSAVRLSEGTLDESIFRALDGALNQGFALTLQAWEKGGSFGFTEVTASLIWLVAGLLIAAGTILIVLVGGCVVITAKFVLALLFALGPLFLLSLMFPQTANLFSAWFSSVLNYTMQLVVVSIILTFALSSFAEFTAAAGDLLSDEASPLLACLQITATAVVFFWLSLQTQTIASGLAGGVSAGMISFSQMARPIKTGAIAAVGGAALAAGGAKAAVRGAKAVGSGLKSVGGSVKERAAKISQKAAQRREQSSASAASSLPAAPTRQKAPLAIHRTPSPRRVFPMQGRPLPLGSKKGSKNPTGTASRNTAILPRPLQGKVENTRQPISSTQSGPRTLRDANAGKTVPGKMPGKTQRDLNAGKTVKSTPQKKDKTS